MGSDAEDGKGTGDGDRQPEARKVGGRQRENQRERHRGVERGRDTKIETERGRKTIDRQGKRDGETGLRKTETQRQGTRRGYRPQVGRGVTEVHPRVEFDS